MDQEQLKELLLQALAHERGGVKVYEAALRCAINDDLKREFRRYLEQTRRHEQVLQEICEHLGIDFETQSPGREVVAHLGDALVRAMRLARESGDRRTAELVACQCVELAETRDHANWDLLSQVAKYAAGPLQDELTRAVEEIEEQEDEHLYHSRGWGRELWKQALGLPHLLPPPEEREHATSAVAAARAKKMSDVRRAFPAR